MPTVAATFPVISTTTLLALALLGGTSAALPAVETITVVPATTHQTIEAWGTAWGAFAFAERDPLCRHMIDEAVIGLGLTRTRIEAQGGNIASGRGPGTLQRRWRSGHQQHQHVQ